MFYDLSAIVLFIIVLGSMSKQSTNSDALSQAA